jgi:hypothetical protein
VPVAQTRGHAGKALLIAATAVVVLLVVTLLVAQAANRGDVEVRLGDDRFDAGKVEDMADTIADDGGVPILYGDLLGRDRSVFVQHTGDEPEAGWVAFGAFVPNEPDCAIEITDERDRIVDCRGREQPLDGEGLRHYPVAVEDGRLLVDINEITTSSTSSSTTSTTSTTVPGAP